MDYKLYMNAGYILTHTRDMFLVQLFFHLPECSLSFSFRDFGSLINFCGLIFYESKPLGDVRNEGIKKKAPNSP